MKLLSSNRGNSLVGVMVAAGIGMIVISGVAMSMVQQGKAISFLEDRLSKVGFDRQIKNIFTTSNTCMNTLGTRTISPTQAVNVIRDRNNNVVYDLGSADPLLKSFEKLDISSINLINIDTPVGPNNNGRMTLQVVTDRQRKGGGINQFAPVQLDLAVSTDAAGQISNCSFLGGAATGVLDEKACILSGMRKTASVLSGPGFGMVGLDQTSNYTPFTEIYLNGEMNIPSIELVRGGHHCWGYDYRVYQEAYSCNNKILTRTSRALIGTARGPYDDVNCGP